MTSAGSFDTDTAADMLSRLPLYVCSILPG